MLSTLVQSEMHFSSVEWIGFCDLSAVDASNAAKLQVKSYVRMQDAKNQHIAVVQRFAAGNAFT